MEQMPEVSQQPNSFEVHKHGKSHKLLMVLLVVLLLAVAGFAGWQSMQLVSQTSRADSAEAAKAGLQSANQSLQSEVDKLKTAKPDTPVSSDSDLILAAVDAYVRAPVAAKNGTYEYKIAEKTTEFARVTVSVKDGGGYQLWLKKVDDTWTVLLGGQDQPSPADVDKYGIPADLLE